MATKPQRTTAERTTPTSNTTERSNSAFARPLPHDLDAERALLGSMLLTKEAIGEAIVELADASAEAFFLEKHQRLFEVMVAIYDVDRPIDGILIKDELERRGIFESLGGYDFLAGLSAAVPHALRARHYAQLVREKHLLRQLIGATHRVMEIAYDDADPAEQILDRAETELFAVTQRRVTTGLQALPDLIRETFERIELHADGALTGMSTGFLEMDELTCGLQPAELIIVAGRPSMGKTAFGLNLAEHMAVTEKMPVLFFSLEMSRQQVAQRILCSRARVNAHRLRRGRHSQADIGRLQDTADELTGAPLLVDDSSSLTVMELRARARMAYRKHQIRAVFVDYLQLMRAPGTESRHLEVGAISAGLKSLAKELEIPVIAMAQLNRQVEGSQRRGNRPRMSDLRESGAIEQDADVIMLLHRESYYQTPSDDPEVGQDNAAEVIVAKQRNGPTDTIKLHFNKQYTRFDNHAPAGDFEPGPYPTGGGSDAPF